MQCRPKVVVLWVCALAIFAAMATVAMVTLPGMGKDLASAVPERLGPSLPAVPSPTPVPESPDNVEGHPFPPGYRALDLKEIYPGVEDGTIISETDSTILVKGSYQAKQLPDTADYAGMKNWEFSKRDIAVSQAFAWLCSWKEYHLAALNRDDGAAITRADDMLSLWPNLEVIKNYPENLGTGYEKELAPFLNRDRDRIELEVSRCQGQTRLITDPIGIKTN